MSEDTALNLTRQEELAIIAALKIYKVAPVSRILLAEEIDGLIRLTERFGLKFGGGARERRE